MDIKKAIADALMRVHGYDKNDPLQKEEWSEEPPSAYSMMLEDADVALNTILENSDGIEDDPEPLLGVVSPPNSSAVHKSAALFIFMETPEGAPTYVRHVREWLEAVENAGISDDAEVEGTLYLSHDVTYEDITKNTSTITLYNHKPR